MVRSVYYSDQGSYRRLKRKFRLKKSSEITRVRRIGKSYAHPLIVLITLPSKLSQSRVAVSAGRSVGNAVQRNRAKRLLREALRPLMPQLIPGWDILVLSRRATADAAYSEIEAAAQSLLYRAHLLIDTHGTRIPPG